MGALEESFEKLLDRQPTDGERQRLYKARDALNIKPTDAVWTLLMIMEHYQTMYEQMPPRIAEAARNAIETIRVTAEAQAKAAREETKKGLMKAVTERQCARPTRPSDRRWSSLVVDPTASGKASNSITAASMLPMR